MNKLLILLCSSLMFLASCHKCYTCSQYCAVCLNGNNGVTYKLCANKDVSHGRVDSLANAFVSSGYTCKILDNDKNVCDRQDKINDAVNYYLLEDYYCYPK